MPERIQNRYLARQAALEQATVLRDQGKLPRFIERKIGPTLDWLDGAPSDAARKAGRPVARIVQQADPRYEPIGYAYG